MAVAETETDEDVFRVRGRLRRAEACLRRYSGPLGAVRRLTESGTYRAARVEAAAAAVEVQKLERRMRRRAVEYLLREEAPVRRGAVQAPASVREADLADLGR